MTYFCTVGGSCDVIHDSSSYTVTGLNSKENMVTMETESAVFRLK